MTRSPALVVTLVLLLACGPVLGDDGGDDAEVLAATDAFLRARDDALARLADADAVDEALGALDAAAAALSAALTAADGDGPAVARARLVLADADLAAGRALADEGQRAARLERALAAYEAHVAEAPAGPGLLFHAYAQRAEALLALGRADEAASAAEELTWVQRPWDPAAPDERAALDALVLDTCLRAFVLQARALVAAGRPADALRALAQVPARPAARGFERHALAPALDIERARALHGLERGDEAAALLARRIAAARAAPAEEHVEGLAMTRAGAVACRALADLDLAGGLPLDDPAVAFDAGLGHLLAGRRDRALGAWRRVLAVARAPEARARWLPDAAERAGRLLLAQERWLEAALTFEALLALAPEAAPPEAARLALLAATRATRQLGEDLTGDGPAARLRRRVEEAVARSPVGAEAEAAGALEAATELERGGRWRDAAAAYLRVPAGASARGRALARAGECLLRAGDDGARACLEAALEALVGASAGADRARAACALAEPSWPPRGRARRSRGWSRWVTRPAWSCARPGPARGRAWRSTSPTAPSRRSAPSRARRATRTTRRSRWSWPRPCGRARRRCSRARSTARPPSPRAGCWRGRPRPWPRGPSRPRASAATRPSGPGGPCSRAGGRPRRSRSCGRGWRGRTWRPTRTGCEGGCARRSTWPSPWRWATRRGRGSRRSWRAATR
ncbi:MAG: hypothetical protein M9894_21325 [Planctomycetes bacterium]|nr:hypothetical protein [Planctomycetota bacterium]